MQQAPARCRSCTRMEALQRPVPARPRRTAPSPSLEALGNGAHHVMRRKEGAQTQTGEGSLQLARCCEGQRQSMQLLPQRTPRPAPPARTVSGAAQLKFVAPGVGLDQHVVRTRLACAWQGPEPQQALDRLQSGAAGRRHSCLPRLLLPATLPRPPCMQAGAPSPTPRASSAASVTSFSQYESSGLRACWNSRRTAGRQGGEGGSERRSRNGQVARGQMGLDSRHEGRLLGCTAQAVRCTAGGVPTRVEQPGGAAALRPRADDQLRALVGGPAVLRRPQVWWREQRIAVVPA